MVKTMPHAYGAPSTEAKGLAVATVLKYWEIKARSSKNRSTIGNYISNTKLGIEFVCERFLSSAIIQISA